MLVALLWALPLVAQTSAPGPNKLPGQVSIAQKLNTQVPLDLMFRDETGKVVSASAVSGHPLLRPAAEQAARQARFTPTLLSGEPVRVTGLLTYNFVLEQ